MIQFHAIMSKRHAAIKPSKSLPPSEYLEQLFVALQQKEPAQYMELVKAHGTPSNEALAHCFKEGLYYIDDCIPKWDPLTISNLLQLGIPLSLLSSPETKRSLALYSFDCVVAMNSNTDGLPNGTLFKLWEVGLFQITQSVLDAAIIRIEAVQVINRVTNFEAAVNENNTAKLSTYISAGAHVAFAQATNQDVTELLNAHSLGHLLELKLPAIPKEKEKGC